MVTIVDNDAPPAQNVIVEGRYGGGGGSIRAVDLLALTILLMAAYFGHRKTRTRCAFVLCLLGAFAVPSKAADDLGWYLGAHAGQVRSTLRAEDIARSLAAREMVATVNAKRQRFGASLELGYQFEHGAQLSAALLNLGEYAVTVSASTANTNQLLRDTADLLGNGGRGLRLAAGWRFAVGSHWSLTPRIGGVWWDSDTEVAIGANSLRRANDALDFFAGIEVSRQFTRTAVALRLERYPIGDRNDIDVLTLGCSYRLRR
jgi:OOP family OmpA-OmpF porin